MVKRVRMMLYIGAIFALLYILMWAGGAPKRWG